MHKPDQGRATRAVTFGLFLAGGLYMGFCWYYWQSGHPTAALVGAVVLAAAVFTGGWFTVFKKEKTSEFLIDLDGELRKVVWPPVQPLFDPKTEAWGSTYVVIACTVVFTALIAALDIVLQIGIQGFLIRHLLMS